MSELMEMHRYRVTVEVPIPAEEWLTQLLDGPNGGCDNCHQELPDPPIYVNTEGQGGADSTADRFCSWVCLLETAAGVVVCDDDDSRPFVTVVEVPDWRQGGTP